MNHYGRIVSAGELFPVNQADSYAVRMKEKKGVTQLRARCTGEVRVPKPGEWYVLIDRNGAGLGYSRPCVFKAYIAELVEVDGALNVIRKLR